MPATSLIRTRAVSNGAGYRVEMGLVHLGNVGLWAPDLFIGTIIFACVFGGAMCGMVIRRALPEHHTTKETEDVIRLGTGVIATLSALVIGLLIASAKSAFDTKGSEVQQFSADLILLDRQLVQYGPETKEARDLLRRYIVFAINTTWPDEASHPSDEASQPSKDARGWLLLEDIQVRLRALVPRDDAQRSLQARALQISFDLARTHWLLDVQRQGAISVPFLVVVVFWLTVIFTSFGLFAPRNATAITALVLCSLSIAGAIYLILEMSQPFSGLIHISSAPMREALAQD